jgi:hypothetical protein
MLLPFAYVVGTRHGNVPLLPILKRSVSQLILVGETVKVRCKSKFESKMFELLIPPHTTVYNTHWYVSQFTALSVEPVIPL